MRKYFPFALIVLATSLNVAAKFFYKEELSLLRDPSDAEAIVFALFDIWILFSPAILVLLTIWYLINEEE